MEKITYLDLPNCYRLSNGDVDVVVTTDVGPRVVRYCLAGGENVLGEVPGASVETPFGEWRPLGGHRLWTAPEAMPRSYVPDNDPVEFAEIDELTIRLRQRPEQATGVQKEITVALDAEGSGVRLLHRVVNRNLWDVELAAWALTIMRGGGQAIIPQEPYGPHPECLLPARALVLWPYTNLADARWSLGPKYIRLATDADAAEPQKIGVSNRRGWAAYAVDETLFVKHFRYEEGASYPDFGCNNEVFTAGSFIEVESLSPLRRLGPGEAAEHVESWHLFGGASVGAGEEDVERVVERFELGVR